MAAKQIKMDSQSAIMALVSSGKIHPYILNNQKMKKELLKNAMHDPLNETNIKKETTKVELGTGAYKEVVFPLLEYWTQVLKDQQGKQTMLDPDGQHTIILYNVRDDMDQTKRKMDSLVHFTIDQEKIQVFFYHKNQSLMVQGVKHQTFYNFFLLPILTKTINEATSEIKEFNCLVIRTLSPGSVPEELNDTVWRSATPDRHHDLRLTRKQASKCEVCAKECGSKAERKNHMETNHNGGPALTAKPRAGVAVSRTGSSLQQSMVQRQLTMVPSVLSPVVPLPPSLPTQLALLQNSQKRQDPFVPPQEQNEDLVPLQQQQEALVTTQDKEALRDATTDSSGLLLLSSPLLGTQDEASALLRTRAMDQALEGPHPGLPPALQHPDGEMAPFQRSPQDPLKEAGPLEAGPPLEETPDSLPLASNLEDPTLESIHQNQKAPLETNAMEQAQECPMFECDKCEFKVNMINELLRHKIQTHENHFRFECDKCEFKVNSANELLKHKKQTPETQVMFECDKCEFKVNSVNELMMHKKRTHETHIKFDCHICRYHSSSKDGLIEHLENVHLATGQLTASGRLIIPDYGFNLDVTDEDLDEDDNYLGFEAVAESRTTHETYYNDAEDEYEKPVDPIPTIPAKPVSNIKQIIHIDETFDVLESETCTVCKIQVRNVTVLQEHILARHCVQSQEVAQLFKMHQQLLNTIITLQTNQQDIIENISKDITQMKQQPPVLQPQVLIQPSPQPSLQSEQPTPESRPPPRPSPSFQPSTSSQPS